ncbi:MAG: D-galactarate dehydratase [Thalassovita sp.]
MTVFPPLVFALVLSACAPLEGLNLRRPTPEPVAVLPEPEPIEETVVAPVTEGFLGRTVAALGDPGKLGFWIETPLTSTAGKGRVTYEKSGRTIKVDLIPIPGEATAGSRLSLSAMQLLDAPLAGLPEVMVYVE